MLCLGLHDLTESAQLRCDTGATASHKSKLRLKEVTQLGSNWTKWDSALELFDSGAHALQRQGCSYSPPRPLAILAIHPELRF